MHLKCIEAKMANIMFLQEIHIFGENTFIHCSRITVVHVDVNICLIFTQRVTRMQTQSNQEVSQR